MGAQVSWRRLARLLFAPSDRRLVINMQTQAVQSVQCFGRKVRVVCARLPSSPSHHVIRRAEDCSGCGALQKRQGVHQVSLTPRSKAHSEMLTLHFTRRLNGKSIYKRSDGGNAAP